MPVRKIIYFISLILLLPLPSSWGFEPAGARVQSLGGAGVALPEETATLFWNPAGLLHHNQIAVDATFQFHDLEWPGTWGISYLNYSPSQRHGAGLGVYRQYIPANHLSDTASVGFAAILATGYRTPLGLPIGLAFKYINEDWEKEGSENYFTADLGTLLSWGALLVGASVQSVTQPKSGVFPYRVLGGFSWHWKRAFTVSTQAGVRTWNEIENPEQIELRAGIEFTLSRVLTLQGGWSRKLAEEFWSSGFGVAGNRGHTCLYLGYHYHPDRESDDRFFLSYDYFL